VKHLAVGHWLIRLLTFVPYQEHSKSLTFFFIGFADSSGGSKRLAGVTLRIAGRDQQSETHILVRQGSHGFVEAATCNDRLGSASQWALLVLCDRVGGSGAVDQQPSEIAVNTLGDASSAQVGVDSVPETAFHLVLAFASTWCTAGSSASGLRNGECKAR